MRNNFDSKYVKVPSNNIIIATEAHISEGKFLLKGQTWKKEKSLMCRAGIQSPTVARRGGQNIVPR
jgi:hypothetical protein